jgi:predicted nucleic acid-binding protein
VLYLDASAIVKLARREPETSDLVDAVQGDPALVSSALSWTEVVRAVRRVGGDTARAEAVLGGVALVPIDDGIVRAAADMEPSTLRSLDAIHLATALLLADDLDRLITYDARLADAAISEGIEVAAPGA